MAGVIFYARAKSGFSEHIQILLGAHTYALRLYKLVLGFEFGNAVFKLLADIGDRALYAFPGRYEPAGWIQVEPIKAA
ncbi:unknown [Coraliomargarita sp. CAG:312]|nr:unknown [Coraliomargarita sp. CAG:312]